VLDDSVDLVLSLHGRRNPTEAARVLRTEGAMLVAVPAPDDLIELRTLVQGTGVQRDRSESLIREHDRLFTVIERATIRETLTLEREALRHLLRGTYRGARLREAERMAEIERMSVTLASDIFVMTKPHKESQ
jgi:23S rRNA (guanine745-N1)-methyltransferase